MTAFPSFGPAARTHRVTAPGGVAMRVVEEGSGPDLVLIPGGDAPAEAFVHLFGHLTAHFRCLAYDPRGIPGTEAPPGPWTIEAMADDCAAVIAALCKGPAVVAGLSMGGLLTQATAIGHPERVRLAIPMGTAAWISGFTRDWMEAEIRLRREGPALPEWFLAVHYAPYAYPAKALGDPALWAEIKAAYTARFEARAPQDLIDQWQACLDYDCRAALPRCPVPFEVIGFSEDVQTPPAMCREVAELAKHGRFHEMPGLGHVSLLRHRPKEVAELLIRIIGEATP